MNILFVHQNFPGQFRHIAPRLASAGNTVYALSVMNTEYKVWQGVHLVPYKISRANLPNQHDWIKDVESKVIRAEACLKACASLKDQKFTPDIIVGHPGWGETMFVKEVWPHSKLVLYCEFFYHATGTDMGFDPEFDKAVDTFRNCKVRMKNINNYMHFESFDKGISPTKWQASTYPESAQEKIKVIHDGINTNVARPEKASSLTISRDGIERKLTANDEVVTFVNRTLEPYRGYHIFLRSLPKILKTHESAEILIIGGNEGGYGPLPDDGGTWQDIFRREILTSLPPSQVNRVHFLGNVSYATYLNVLQVSSVHVYLTYPFVLSWSMLEAMSCSVPVIASDTQPVTEVLKDGENGVLVDFFDFDAISHQVNRILTDKKLACVIGENGRTTIVKHYDLETKCIPEQLNWIMS